MSLCLRLIIEISGRLIGGTKSVKKQQKLPKFDPKTASILNLESHYLIEINSNHHCSPTVLLCVSNHLPAQWEMWSFRNKHGILLKISKNMQYQLLIMVTLQWH